MRTSTDTFWAPPTRWNFCSTSTRSTLPCVSHRHVGDFVDVERAAVRFLERADLARAARAVLGAEQLLLDPVRRHGRRVEHDERPVGALRFLMHDAGGQLLAGAGRAADQDAAVGRRHAVDRVAQLVDGRRLADHVGADSSSARAARFTSRLQLRGLERAQRHEHQAVGLERLLDVVVGAALDGGDGGLDVAVAGDDHHRQVGVCPLDVGRAPRGRRAGCPAARCRG